MNYWEAKEKFDKLDNEADLKFSDIIEYQHLDGTKCRFHFATYIELGDDWYGIFTEHNGSSLISKLDTKWIKRISEECIYFNEKEDL